MAAGKPRFRTVGCDLEAARAERLVLVAAARRGAVPACPRLRFSTVVERWLARFEAMVAAGERRERTLEAHRYHLEHHLLPAFPAGPSRRSRCRTSRTCSSSCERRGTRPKTIASALATLRGVLRFALRRDWIVADPVAKLEADERPRLPRRHQRVLGRNEIARLLACSPDGYRVLTITLDVYTHLFDEARHRRELRVCMAASPFAALLEDEMQRTPGTVTPLMR